MPLTNLPPYNEQNTKNWFLQLEAIFSVRRITSQEAKFANVVQVLPPSVVDEVADILEHVPEQEPYTRLKDAILKRTGRSDEELLRELFTHVTRGDRTPSQLLRFMRSRLGKHSIAESILRELWMDKLPTTITQILAQIADSTPLDQLANSADRIATKLDQGVCAVQRPDDTPAKDTDLEKAVADLQHHLQDIRMLLSRKSRGPMLAVGDGERGVPAGIDESTRNYAGTITDSAPGQGIARHPANTAPKPSRKTKQPAGRSGRTPRQKHTKPPFLLDTGAAISVIPHKEQQDRKATPYKLQAANGSTIETYGAKTLTLNIGMRRDFTWTFTQADVKTPILGADFLAHYDLAVHMNTRTLSDNTTNIAVKGTLSRHNTTGISVTTCHGREYIEILNRYPDLIQPLAGTGPAKHQTQHQIKTSGQPTFSHPRRLPPHKLEYAQKEFNNMLKDGFIRPSDSPYASPLHLVPKPGSTDFRVCVDYSYPVPHIHDFASGLQGTRVFLKIDLTKAYHQIPIAPEDIPKTAVTTPFGLFEYLKMPFGLRNAAQAFQGFIDEVLRGLTYAYAYIDDLIVASTDENTHKQHLNEVFQRIALYGLRLNIDKCTFGASESTQGRTDYTSAVRVDPLSPQVPTRSLIKYRHPGIDWTSNTAIQSAYLQAVALKPDNVPSKLHDRTTTNDYLYILVPDYLIKFGLNFYILVFVVLASIVLPYIIFLLEGLTVNLLSAATSPPAEAVYRVWREEL
ncbi:unnamed protein product [Acanthosepion pharaonis]|uniref:Reverse transcriptase domain-containing protein n=1 Tax=Acanthosepion pharaonis TaxID=158019 RepID=A0A812DGJ4_ACAPH|nr:unnamed protein product [Sepia pharaonis]